MSQGSEEKCWYYSSSGEKHGPITTLKLRQLAATGELKPSDQIWKDGWEEWRTAASVKALFPDSPKIPSGSPSPKAVQTIHAAADAADQVSKKLWFLDLKFESFATPRLIGFVFVASLLTLCLLFIGIIFYALWTLPVLQAAFVIIVDLLMLTLLAVFARVWLEIFLLSFRIAESLNNLRYLKRISETMDT